VSLFIEVYDKISLTYKKSLTIMIFID